MRRRMAGLLGLVVLGSVVVIPVVSQAQSVADVCPPGETCDSVAFQDGSGRFHFWDRVGAPNSVSTFFYGNPGDVAFSGDWNCDGEDTLGLYRQSDGYVYLRNSNTQGNADITFFFGNPGDYPIAGDFNGNGCDTVSIYRPSEARFYIINTLGSNDGGLGAADFSFLFGNFGDKPFVGDFNGNGIDSIGLHRESTGLVYFRNSLTTGIADSQFIYGNPGDMLVAGDWDGDGDDTVAVYRPSNGAFYVKLNNTQGIADYTFYAGPGFTGVVVAPRNVPAPPTTTTSTTTTTTAPPGLCETQTAVPESECDALEAFYVASGGSGWIDDTGWGANLDVCVWKGVTCTSGHVTTLNLFSNGLTGQIAPQLANLTNLQSMVLFSNSLSGPVPPELGNLTNLKYLYLQLNDLTGEIPDSLGQLTNLIQLNLLGNELSGLIPSDLGALTNLQVLELSFNGLSGEIPVSLGGLVKLTDLFLNNNDLSGSIPDSLGNLTMLEFFSLRNNQLAGQVPETLLQLTQLLSLYLRDQTGCLTAGSVGLQTWLTDWDPEWDNGCPPVG